MNGVDVERMRNALAELPDGTSHGDEAPDLGDVYFPQSHLKALHPDVLVVTGMRGAGKTFWWSALQNKAVRQLMEQRYARAKLSGSTILRTGFGVRTATDEYPGKDVLERLLQDGTEPRSIWRTVQAWQIARSRWNDAGGARRVRVLKQQPVWENLRYRCGDDWTSRTAYVRQHPEMIDRLFEEEDARLNEEGRHCVVLYDALDRAADEWKSMYRIIRGLLQTALDMRSCRRIRMKIFLRTDQLDKAEVGDFPDASKVLSSAVELGWPSHELYGLLWHRLGNAKSFSKSIRAALHRSAFGDGNNAFGNGDDEWRRLTVDKHDGFWRVPHSLVSDESIQRKTFHSITGGWMGKDRRRGFPYTWIPNHLGDTKGKVSPRSFLAALKSAAEDTRDRHADHGHALHYDSIKRGVREASGIRVKELKEDYPWVDRLLKSLHGMVTPCDFADVAERWAERGALDHLRDEVESMDVKLPPSRIEEGPDGVRQDLESLHVFLRMHDGRVNVPDVFRIGYGLGRRGGVRPVR